MKMSPSLYPTSAASRIVLSTISGSTLPWVTMYGPTDTSAPSGSMIAVAASLPVISTFDPEQRMYWMPISSTMLRRR